MPEPTSPSDQADRIRRLQERRAGTGSRPTATTGAPATRSKATQARRRRPAAATRILLAGLSVASFFTVAGTLAANQTSTPVAQTASTIANPVTAAQPISAAPSSFAATPAKPSTVTNQVTNQVVPHTTSHAS